jgi:predicted  nucleic acid-binding Zn-ribbon protein
MKAHEQDRRDFTKQAGRLEGLREKEIMANTSDLIAEIRDFKEKIKAAMLDLDDTKQKVKDLNNELIMQDMGNAIKVLERKAGTLRERLVTAESELKKIDTVSEDMDGNCSNNEEEEFIDALKDEMPEVFTKIKGNFDQLDTIDDLIEEIKRTKSIDTLHDLK